MTIEQIRDAITELAATPSTEPLAYTPSPVGLDTHRYDIDGPNALHRYPDDAKVQAAAQSANPHADIAVLALSPHWEDRIRANAVRAALHNGISLPNDFPCIYEPAGSRNAANTPRRTPFAWVVSPDEAMLHDLLPLYRELWDAYESQWPHTPNRTFEVGRLSGLPAVNVYRPGTTPSDVIGTTMLTHTDMYARAPEHLRQMHPLHAQWEAAKMRTKAQFHPHKH